MIEALSATGLDARQGAYLLALALATIAVRNRIAAVMWANAVITLAGLYGRDIGAITPQAAAVYGAWGDFACGCVLLRWRGAAPVVGLLYMPVAIWTIAGFVIGLPSYDTYTFSYVMGYIQLAVVMVKNGRDGLGSGGGRGYRRSGGDGRIYRSGLLPVACRAFSRSVGLAKGGRE